MGGNLLKQSINKTVRDPWIIFAFVCMIVSVGFIFYPQLQTIMTSFQNKEGSGFTFHNFIEFFQKKRYTTALINSLQVVFFSTLLASALALPLAYLFSKFDFRFKNTTLTLITMASSSPPFLGAYAWVILLGRYGVLNKIIDSWFHYDLNWKLRGEAGVVWVIIWLIFPLVFLLSYDSFSSQDPSLKEASMSLGANKRKTLWRVEVPLAMPGVITGLFMAALAAFSDFGTPAIIGGEFPVMPTLVYSEFVSEVGGNLNMASAVGVIMILVASVALMIQRYLLAKKTYASVSAKRPLLVKASKGMKAVIGLYIGAIISMSFLPHLTLLVVSLMKWKWGILTNQFTLDNYVNLFKSHLAPIGVSFMLGSMSTLLDVIFGVGIAYLIVRKRYKFISSFVNISMMVPYIIPGTVLAIGFIVVFNKPPVILTGTWIILVLVSFIRKLPFSIKSAESSLYLVHKALEDAALMCGARPFTAFKDITFKLMIGGVISGATLSFLQIMTELSSTLILYRPPWVTMPVVIFQNAMTAGADFGISAAMGVVLMTCIYVPLLLVNKSSRKKT
ncbi:ABC transporter permease [Paenibacillus roseipurpureus]|uniref:Iron ABC transporter permease n=1 Tax=Paenibacillus roseopurpureus TaxID=2918901 RepID=A0AA96LSP0_9BACL|nr:iron ABC transporter permease [Paenibacillus sp. MBLB1832]WNR45354.1 iron ABC transporter permease [Paenibacillus sp. MBLB1832]